MLNQALPNSCLAALATVPDTGLVRDNLAIVRAAISWFPMDAPGADRTPTGQMHGLLAIGTR